MVLYKVQVKKNLIFLVWHQYTTQQILEMIKLFFSAWRRLFVFAVKWAGLYFARQWSCAALYSSRGSRLLNKLLPQYTSTENTPVYPRSELLQRASSILHVHLNNCHVLQDGVLSLTGHCRRGEEANISEMRNRYAPHKYALTDPCEGDTLSNIRSESNTKMFRLVCFDILYTAPMIARSVNEVHVEYVQLLAYHEFSHCS